VSARTGLLTDTRHLSPDTYELFLPWRFLLGDSLPAWAFTSARVCMRPLTPNRQRSAMPQATVAPDVHQSLDVHLDALS
jgi:hypothetical protein